MTLHDDLSVAVHDDQSAEASLEQAKADVAAACRLAALYGWDDQIATHISARVPGTHDRFVINPFGLFFEEVTASSVIEIDEDGNAVDGSRVNLAGFTIHSAIHRARHDARCVIHLHTTAGIAVGAQVRGLLTLSPTAMLVQPVAYHDWEGISVDAGERERLVDDLGSSHVMFLRNHGTIAVGPTMAEAFRMMYFLERACTVQVAASAGGHELVDQPLTVAEHAQGQQRGGFRKDAADLAWRGLLRKLDRIDSGWRD